MANVQWESCDASEISSSAEGRGCSLVGEAEGDARVEAEGRGAGDV